MCVYCRVMGEQSVSAHVTALLYARRNIFVSRRIVGKKCERPGNWSSVQYYVDKAVLCDVWEKVERNEWGFAIIIFEQIFTNNLDALHQ